MRKIIRKYYPGDRQVCKAFLVFPKTINGDRRWLEVGEWEDELQLEQNNPNPVWKPIRWADQPDVESSFMTFHKRRDIPPSMPPLHPPADQSAYQGVPMGIQFDKKEQLESVPDLKGPGTNPVPAGRDQSLAITHLEDSVMRAIRAITQ